MKIGIIGNYGATNIGDDAILTALLKQLSAYELTVFSANPDETHKQFGVKSAPLFPLGVRTALKGSFQKARKAIKSADVVILGGGGLFQDDRLYACFLWAWQVFWVKRFRKPLFIYGTGVGPLKTRLGKRLTKWAYRQADTITVRDGYSRDLLHRIGLSDRNIAVTADPVFIYRKPKISKDRTKNLFMISLRPWLKYNPKIIHVFTAFLKKLKESKSAEIKFVCMQAIKERDHQVIDPILREVGGELYIPRHFSDLIQVMLEAEFVIGMRYHFLIAALLTQTPVLPISYGPKVDELFKGTPLEPYLMKVADLSADRLKEGLKRLSVDYNNVKVYERSQAHHLEELAHQNGELFEDFLKTIDENKKD